MFEEKTDELYRLFKEVRKEAKTYVALNLSTGSTCLYIWDKGLNTETSPDGNYTLYENEVLKEETEQQYKLAKEHLERLLQERSNTVCM